MNLQELIKSFKGFVILEEENSQSIKFMADCRSNDFKKIDTITKVLAALPTAGSNAFLGNKNMLYNPAIYKVFRLSLSDFTNLSEEDIEFRIELILKEIKKEEQHCDTELEQKSEQESET